MIDTRIQEQKGKNVSESQISCFETERVMEKALDIGEAMLRCGGEILRVEDTIMRICLTYGDGIIDVFTILSLIIVSWHTADNKNYTQTRRIYSYSTDLEKLEELNSLSRYICQNRPGCDEIEEKVEQILQTNIEKKSLRDMLGYILGSGGFAIFFGGCVQDGIAAAIVSIFMYFWNFHYAKHSNNRIVYMFITSLVVGLLCILSVVFHIGVNQDKVMIGTIMLLIPGINMMISIRDMICNDIITGLLRLAGSLMEAVAIAAGYAVAIMIFQVLPF